MIDHETHLHSVATQARGAIGLLTEDEVARTLQLNSTSTLATWRSQGKGPPSVKLGKKVFYTVRDLSTWIVEEGQRQNAPANDNAPQQAAA